MRASAYPKADCTNTTCCWILPAACCAATESLFAFAAWAPTRCLPTKARPQQGRYKKRHEIEVVLPDAFKVEQIFNEIGYHPIFRYEKFRTEYAKAPGAGKVLLDETPIGNYMEIEGSPRWIDSTARLLGFSTADYITRSYGYLYLAYCRERRISPTDMLFTAKEMKQLRKNKSNV